MASDISDDLQSQHERAPKGAAVTDRLIRITTALAVLAVADVAAIISYLHACELVSSHGETGMTAPAAAVHGGRSHLGSIHGGARRESAEPPCTTTSRVESQRGHRGNSRCQPGARPGTRPDRRRGQRLARPGADRLIRTPDAAH
jgi:hypothetical protein